MISSSLLSPYLTFDSPRPNSDNGWEKENFRRLNTKAYVPYIKYKLRLIKNKTLKDEIDKKTIKSMPWINIPVSWASLRMRWFDG